MKSLILLAVTFAASLVFAKSEYNCGALKYKGSAPTGAPKYSVMLGKGEAWLKKQSNNPKFAGVWEKTEKVQEGDLTYYVTAEIIVGVTTEDGEIKVGIFKATNPDWMADCQKVQ